MKKFFKGLAALAICGALNFGLTTNAQAATVNLIDSSGIEFVEMMPPPPPPPPPPRHHRVPPPPPDYYDHNPPPPPPPPPPHW